MDPNDVRSEWRWARGLTLDLLRASSEDDLHFRLGPSCGALWKQFRHVGRVHENYLDGIETARVEFGVASCTYSGGPSRSDLLAYFERLLDRHESLLDESDPETTVDWFGDSASLGTHLLRLHAHETLHHGQLILYWRALENEFPESWADWGM